MKYEITPRGVQLYAPDDPFELNLVFDILAGKVSTVPYALERDRDSPELYRQGAWFAWPFHLRDIPPELVLELMPLGEVVDTDEPSAEQVFLMCPTIMVDVALPLTYRDEILPECRWSTILPGDIGNVCFAALIKVLVDPAVTEVEDEEILVNIHRLYAACRERERKRKRTR